MTAAEAMAGWLGLFARAGVLERRASGDAIAAFVVGEDRVRELAQWFASADETTVRRERRAAIELCIWMAHADREVDPEERHLLRELVASSGLDEDTQDALVSAVHEPPSSEGVEERITQPILRELMLALAWELAMADGRIDRAESKLYGELASRLGVTRERAREIRDAISAKLT